MFLAAWTIGLWAIFPIVFVLEKQRAINHDQGAVIQVSLDILAKVRLRVRLRATPGWWDARAITGG